LQISIRKIKSKCGLGEDKAFLISQDRENIKIKLIIVCPTSCCWLRATSSSLNKSLKIYLSQTFKSRIICLQCVSLIEFELTINNLPSDIENVEIFYKGQKLLHFKRLDDW